MLIKKYTATAIEQHQAMSADSMVPHPIYTETRAITIHAPVERIWPWLAQMGSARAGWYAYDWIDNGGHPSAKVILPEFQQIRVGDIFPALPGMKDVFLVTAVDPPCDLVLTMPDARLGSRVSWEFQLKPIDQGNTRLVVRGRVAPHWLAAVPQPGPAPRGGKIFIEQVYGLIARLPRPLMLAAAGFGHGLMQTRQLKGIKVRAEA